MKVVKFNGKEGIWEMYDGTVVTIDDVINQLVKKDKLGDQEECARFKAFIKSPIDHEVYRNNTELFELIKELYDSELITLLAHYLIENNVYFEINYTPALISLTANLYLHKLNTPIIKDNDKYHRVKEMKELIENISFQGKEYSFKMDSHIFTMNLKKREAAEYEMRKIIVDDDIPSHHICIETLDGEFSRSFDVALRNVADLFELIFGLQKNYSVK